MIARRKLWIEIRAVYIGRASNGLDLGYLGVITTNPDDGYEDCPVAHGINKVDALAQAYREVVDAVGLLPDCRERVEWSLS